MIQNMPSSKQTRTNCILPQMLRGAIVLLILSLSTETFAQNRKTLNTRESSVPLHSFQGYFQLPNKVAFIAFEQRDNILFATQLWNKQHYQLIRTGDTSFESKNEGYKIEFEKDSTGSFNRAKILGRILSTRVAFNPTSAVILSTSQLQRLAGTYSKSNDSNFKLKILPSASGLELTQLWDNKTINFTPRSDSFFLNDDDTFPLTFNLQHGKVVELICFESDIWLKID